MSERYTKLFALPEQLFSTGSPVMIAAGALQKDNQTGKVFAQLKLRNIQDKVIKAATVRITPFDTLGKPLDGAADHQYLDLSAERDMDFGQKTPILLQDLSTRSFTVAVLEVIFSDNSVWTASGGAWEPLSQPVPLEKALEDRELVKQYRLKYGSDCQFMYQPEKDLWRCSCGALNRGSEGRCHSCLKEAAALAALDLEGLKAARDARLEEEQKQAAERKAAAAEQARKVKKIAMIAVPAAIVLIAAFVLISGHMEKSGAYNEAAALLEAHEFDDAMDAFAELGDFKDSHEQAYQNAAYQKALYLIDCAEHDSAAGLKVSSRTQPKPKPAESDQKGASSAAGSAAATSAAPSSAPSDGGEWFDSDFDTIDEVTCYRKAGKILSKLDGYKDSAALLERIKESSCNAQYEHAMALLTEEYEYKDAYNTLMDLDGYKDSAEIAQQVFDENQQCDNAYSAYWNGDLEPFMEVIKNNQYVKPSDEDVKNVQFLYSLVGKWEYLSGDATVLTKYDEDDTDYSETLSVETNFVISKNSNTPSIRVNYEGSSATFTVDFDNLKLKSNTGSSGNTLSVKLTAQDTLQIKRSYHYYAPGPTINLVQFEATCEYQRVK